ncbi:MAG: hypothetical protein RMJ28_06100 [Nitrososphaerota archaeon]|nr:hypothetical protein [Candidatus Calditenuaceae archaeon]MDW8073786.1 hypothetical protein [Nitrososphaerota archaeon]
MSVSLRAGGAREVWKSLREIIADLRGFLETDDYRLVVSAHERCEAMATVKEAAELSGFKDLQANLKQMREKIEKNGYNLSTIEHGLLAQQAVYAISRANILATGLEFRFKRARGG